MLLTYVSFIWLTYLAQIVNGKSPKPQKFSVLKDAVADVAEWTYGNGRYGPYKWPILFPKNCMGRFQSPVNIQTRRTTYDPSLKRIIITSDRGSDFEVHNNGHAVEVNAEGDFFVSGGGLSNKYKTAQFHFHWGSGNRWGSEHTIDGHHYPLEMHIVNWNTKYKSADVAKEHADGLAVLSILFRLSLRDNPVLRPIVNELWRVRDPDDHVLASIDAFPLTKFLPRSPERYYRYNGSLTTPHCNEAVIWTVFEEKQYVSRRQLRYFRKLLTSSLHDDTRKVRCFSEECPEGDGGEDEGRVPLEDNFRPTQPLHGRTVYRSFRGRRERVTEDYHRKYDR